MNKLFEHLSANWFHYMDYEWRTAKDGLEYLMPTADAKAMPYDPLKRADQLLLEAMEIGMQIMHRAPKEKLRGRTIRKRLRQMNQARLREQMRVRERRSVRRPRSL